LSVYSTDISLCKQTEQLLVDARELERSRIARALHDEALQGLSDALALAMRADTAPAGDPANRATAVCPPACG
jgi:signal transduction histidine kinase